MARKKTPLERLLSGIEKKRRLSLKEFGKTDLDKNATPDDVAAWYDQLSALVREEPPAERVRILRILEDGAGGISGVEYVYHRKERDTQAGAETVFVIETRVG